MALKTKKKKRRSEDDESPRRNGKSSRTDKKGKTTLVVDFTNVEKGFSKVPEGDYLVKVVGAKIKESEKSDYDYIAWDLEIIAGDKKGVHVGHITSLAPQALFNLRSTLEALGVDVPKSKMKIDFKSLIGNSMGVAIENEKYQGKTRSRVVDCFAAESEDDLKRDDDDEDEDEDDLDDEDDDDEDDSDSDDDDEEEAEDEEDSDDEDEEEEEAEEEDEKKSSKKRPSKSKDEKKEKASKDKKKTKKSDDDSDDKDL